jgi:adenylate cyclase
VLTLVPLGLLAGTLVTLRVARSVADPLDDLRGDLDRVRRGDLEAKTAVDDLTEIGLLQAGFNEMVAGLRERAQLEDLFGRHVGVDVARKAVEEGGLELGGEQRDLSALFVDLVGSTKLAATRPPEEVVALLNDVFEAVVHVASEEGGWVNKFEGDAALCVFGAPAHDPRHAEHALRAARRLHEQLVRLAERHPGLDAGIGVSAGAAVAGNVGAEQRFEYTVIGDPVNEAARLTEEAKALPGRVLASGAAMERGGEEAANWCEAATLDLRGRPDPTTAWEPLPSRPS